MRWKIFDVGTPVLYFTTTTRATRLPLQHSNFKLGGGEKKEGIFTGGIKGRGRLWEYFYTCKKGREEWFGKMVMVMKSSWTFTHGIWELFL